MAASQARGEITQGVVFHCGDIDWGAVARTHQPSQGHCGTAVGCEPIARLWRHQSRGDDPADVPLIGQITRAPRAAGASFVNADERMALGWELTDALVEVTWARTDRPAVDDLRARGLGHGGDCKGLFVDLHAAIQGGRLGHG